MIKEGDEFVLEIAAEIQRLFGNNVQVTDRVPVSGGDINEAYRLCLSDGCDLFIKLNDKAGEDFFLAEKAGLEALRAAGANTPQVLGYGKLAGNSAYLLLEYVRSACPQRNYGEMLGHMLAEVHRAAVDNTARKGRFGFYRDNYIGQIRQKNKGNDSWIEFFRTSRMAVQFDLAADYLDKEDRRKCQNLLDHLDKFLIEPAFPSLLHGDLWSGNVMPDSQGNPMLIDPAVYVGHHEADLAMTELFGGFPPEFYDAYHEIIPREPGYADRRDLYNLYHLLNHLNLFGSSYLAAIRRIVKRYM